MLQRFAISRENNRVERLNDRKTLRLTCSRLALILRPFVFKEITLNIHKYKLIPGLSLLRALASPDNIYSQCVRTLYIDSLSPSFFPDPEFKEKEKACKSTVALYELARDWVSDGEDRATREYEELGTLLKPALESLKDLVAVHWCWHHKDEWAVEPVMQSLSSFRNLRECSFCDPYLGRPQFAATPFPEINQNLKALSIDISPPSTAPFPLLRFTTPASHSSHSYIDLSLFGFNTLGSSRRSCITHLCLNLESPEVLEIRNYFPNLTSLELRSRYANGRYHHTFEPLFSGLQSEQIYLRRLVVDILIEPVLDYTGTYSGLEVLSLKGPKWYSQPTSDESADRFYEEILPLHNGSLVKLEMEPEFESRWCFGENNAEVASASAGTFVSCQHIVEREWFCHSLIGDMAAYQQSQQLLREVNVQAVVWYYDSACPLLPTYTFPRHSSISCRSRNQPHPPTTTGTTSTNPSPTTLNLYPKEPVSIMLAQNSFSHAKPSEFDCQKIGVPKRLRYPRNCLQSSANITAAAIRLVIQAAPNNDDPRYEEPQERFLRLFSTILEHFKILALVEEGSGESRKPTGSFSTAEELYPGFIALSRAS
ncbi:hypothetical protein D9758_007029 [Tetrapyrgos nigripes]|uniref:Uncharacterized protein n=1 Tax=Tetrapyrgos nigripes TaxID=182062 RepID=A0A8H5LMT4_9AGAR|nr:hypothetical protein D9758_007029 [Tetrapyrgos nigripes]